MKIPVMNESVQLIHIGPSTSLTMTSIQYALYRAMANKMYAKFYTDKYYIQINFMKDNTISVSSNITVPQFVQDYKRNDRLGWNFSRAKDFVYRWMQVSRRSLG